MSHPLTLLQGFPFSPVCLVMSLLPNICSAKDAASSGLWEEGEEGEEGEDAEDTHTHTTYRCPATHLFASFTPPFSPEVKRPFPLPPANTCAFTTDCPPERDSRKGEGGKEHRKPKTLQKDKTNEQASFTIALTTTEKMAIEPRHNYNMGALTG